jgi:phage replication initiation protein
MSRVKSLLFGVQSGRRAPVTRGLGREDGSPVLSSYSRNLEGRQAACSISTSISEPPRATQGGKPIHANRWVHERFQSPPVVSADSVFEEVELVLKDGDVKKVLTRTDRTGTAFHDWITVTFDVAAFMRFSGVSYVTDDDIAEEMSRLTERLGLHGISAKREHGRYFHKHCWVLGDGFGEFVCGHRSGRAMLSISGQGLLHASVGAMSQLHRALCAIDDAGGDVRLTRVDLAMDFFSGGPTHEDIERAYIDGKFVRQQRHIDCPDVWPQFVTHGCKYTKRGHESGLTDYIGSRNSDLFARRYDKGRAEGDPNSAWVRFEVEMKGRDTVIPLDILLNPQKYFCQYPYLTELVGGVADRLETKRKRAEIAVDASKRIIKIQFGKYLRVLRDLMGDDARLLDELQHEDPDAWPIRLARISPNYILPIHKSTREYPLATLTGEVPH